MLTIPPNNFDANSSHGEGKVFNLLTNLMPEYDLVLLVVNDLEYGGSGGSIFITSLNVDSPEIVVHESGHTFGGLTDEYADPFPGYTPTEKPNATAETNRALIKWNSWILPSTPLPTPEDVANASLIGLFEGAQYQSNGWYRPKLDCKMRTLGVPFCEVCSEALVEAIYRTVRPIDSFSPSTTNLAIHDSSPVLFGIGPLQPTTHDLYIQWLTDNVPVSGETNFTFQLAPQTLGNGAHTIRAVLNDPTQLVRSDPANRLRGTNTWSITISMDQLALIDPLLLSDGRFRLTVTGAAPQGFVIQSSTDLVNWAPLSTNSLSGGRFDYTNSSQAGLQYFYRAYSPP